MSPSRNSFLFGCRSPCQQKAFSIATTAVCISKVVTVKEVRDHALEVWKKHGTRETEGKRVQHGIFKEDRKSTKSIEEKISTPQAWEFTSVTEIRAISQQLLPASRPWSNIIRGVLSGILCNPPVSPVSWFCSGTGESWAFRQAAQHALCSQFCQVTHSPTRPSANMFLNVCHFAGAPTWLLTCVSWNDSFFGYCTSEPVWMPMELLRYQSSYMGLGSLLWIGAE